MATGAEPFDQLLRRGPPALDPDLNLSPASAAGRASLTCLAVEPSASRFLLCGGIDGRLHLMDLRAGGATTKRSTRRDHAACVVGLGWYGDGGCFASADSGGGVRFWDAMNFVSVCAWDLGRAVGAAALAAFASGPLATVTAAGCGDGGVRLCDARAGSCATTLDGCHVGAVAAVAWHPTDGFSLATGGADGTARLWVRRFIMYSSTRLV